MTRQEKDALLQELQVKFQHSPGFYLVNLGDMNVQDSQAFRRALYEKGLRARMVKNTLIYKALSHVNASLAEEVKEALHYPSVLIWYEGDIKAPAEVLASFQKPDKPYPAFKAAVIEGVAYVGPDKLETVRKLKSKQELLSDILAALQAPLHKVLGGLQGAGTTLHGILKTLSEKTS
ncbi:MAG: 50S ribosomal protein L10 [Bacteroidia bacterium]